MAQHEDFASCYNASSPTNSNKSKETSFPVIWDRDDFINFSSNSTLRRLNSVGSGHDVHGEGAVLWSIVDSTSTDVLRHLKVKDYYLPTSRVRLLSTNALLKHYPDETVIQNHDSLVLSGVAGASGFLS